MKRKMRVWGTYTTTSRFQYQKATTSRFQGQKTANRETEIINPRHRDSKTFFQRTKNHNIEIPRLKSHDIEFPRNSDPYAFWYGSHSVRVKENRLLILPVKFTQNRQNKQRHFYSTVKIARRLSKSIVGWSIHMARSQNWKFLSGLCAQWEGVSAVQVMQWFNDSHQKYIITLSKTRNM